ncbi:hypothetical protein [Streptomyces cacaoi]|uniref:Uncharacterized protein n=1 Tax=Streptomyces cacaoi TaxID=1898 RepID=A0A4Y3R792_STRCI|nr:hypothetical protein [Streptomyces cacaoi]NNG85686.1 hypothetical protein [Streptomyces cacaoi]GEB53626.1 hypothetical protein SCA03_61770 [Streptomyces cacaoi]
MPWTQQKGDEAVGAGTDGKSSSPGMKPGGHIPQDTDLVHSRSKQKAAARYIQDTLGPATHTAGSKADEDTETLTGNPESPTTVRGKLHSWEVWTGVRHRLTVWRAHHDKLVERLQYEHQALLDTGVQLGETDVRTSDSMGRLSEKPRIKSRLDDLSREQ